MPPSAGACQTIEAAEKPDCGRAGPRSSIITAIGWRCASAALTGSPSSGPGTSEGPGDALGIGLAEDADGATPELWEGVPDPAADEGDPVVAGAEADGLGLLAVTDGAKPRYTTNPRPSSDARATIATRRARVMSDADVLPDAGLKAPVPLVA
jgi:hypothetical protein